MNRTIMRLLCLLLALALCCGLVGCYGNEDPTDPTDLTDPTDPTDLTDPTDPTDLTDPTDPTQTDPTVHTHEYTGTTHEATCTQGGYVEYVCACGDSYIGDQTAPTGHSYESETVAPGEGTQGYTLHTCRKCGLNYKDNYIWGNTGDVAEFFSDAAFIGDSVSLALRNYNMTSGALGNATFLCQGNYAVRHAVSDASDRLLLSYQGKNMDPEDALKACGAKKVFIMLGMNDIALMGVDKTLENWAIMIGRIRQENPDIQIYIQSATPIYTAGQVGGLNNERMDEYNARLKTFAQESGCHFIDIGTSMKDSTNGLAKKYCSDEYVHLTNVACELWVSILKSYIQGD